VADEYQGRGLGTLLLKHLVTVARLNGIAEFEAEILSGNRNMRAVFQHSGFPVTTATEAGATHISFPITKHE